MNVVWWRRQYPYFIYSECSVVEKAVSLLSRFFLFVVAAFPVVFVVVDVVTVASPDI